MTADPLVRVRALELPNGMIVEQIGGVIETIAIYREIFDDDVYLKDVDLPDGAVVVDIGANVGLFVLRLLSLNKPLSILAIEPVPALFQLLSTNVAAHTKAATDVKLFNIAVGAVEGEADFEFYPRATAFSTMFPDDRKRLEPWLLEDLLKRYPAFRKRFPVVGFLLYPFRRWLVRLAIKRTTKALPVHCRVRALSTVLDENPVAKIDLLKIDVEGAELEALRGIRDDHWALVRQVSMEVQDLDGRLAVITAMLVKHGFALTFKPEMATESAVRMVYARR